MKDILIRDIPDEVASALSQKAEAANQDRMAWIRDLLIRAASEPVVRERYAYRFYGRGETRGIVRRLNNHVNGVGGGYDHCSAMQADAVQMAQNLMRRNEPGDQMKAYDLLKSNFDEVFEVPA